ncbi:MAG: type II toxin-antitoxin system YafQ family toxin [bacterium]|nr:type II toxin-antitoxin system YafQ family toxin [bacterium]
MLTIVWQSQFKKDFRNAKNRGKKLDRLTHILEKLQHNEQLPLKNKNHKLKGNYTNCWECHIEPDWLLIYQLTPDELILIRTGSHSDLF